MANFESNMGPGRDQGAPAPESGMGATEGESRGAPEQGMGATEGYKTGAHEQGMGSSTGESYGAPEQGMGADEGGIAPNQSTSDYGMGSGRVNDQKEGGGGKLLDKVKGMVHHKK